MEILVNHLMEILVVVITTFVGIGFTVVQKYFKNKWQIDIGNYVNNVEIINALETQIKKLKKQFGNKVDDYEFENKAVENVVEFIGEQFPKWTKEYGFTPETLENYIRNKYTQLID